MPPSGAMAGVYAAIDATRGVWKAPANVSLTNVVEPTVKLDNVKQDDLNVDATAASRSTRIRAFAGKGTLVWGARTLAGNDNEWRYVSVRRFFNMVEESVKKSTYWAVFEPNDANTWVKVRGMIENYLTDKWREGALAGADAQGRLLRQVRPGHDHDRAGHPRGPDERRDRHGRGPAGRVHHPQVLPQDADVVSATLASRIAFTQRRIRTMPAQYPLPVFHFTVEWGGSRVGFSEVTGLTQENQAIEYRDGSFPEYSSIKMPGLRKFTQHHAQARHRQGRQRVLQVAEHGQAEHRRAARPRSSACSTRSTSR